MKRLGVHFDDGKQEYAARDARRNTLIATGAAVAVGGAIVCGVIAYAGASTDPNPVDTSRMRELADDYNKRLKQQLRVSLLPLVSPQSAGLALNVRF
jgi:hypothetical protein